jgi:hypothetical protein
MAHHAVRSDDHMIRGLRSVGLLTAAGLAAAVLCASSAAAAAEPKPSEVKAAFLANFTKFTEWPTDVLPAGAPLTVCVMGDEEVADALDRLVKSRPGQGRELKAVRLNVNILSRPEDSTLRSCQMLYVSGLDTKMWAVLLNAIEGAPVFSVSDSEGFAERGGLAALYVELKRMRFAINIDTVRRSGLHLSSGFLDLARIIKDDPNRSRR